MAFVLRLIFIILGFLTLVGIVLYHAILGRREARVKDMRENPPRFKNFARADFTKGYISGLLVKETPTKNNCIRFEFLPTGVEKVEGKKKPQIQTVIYHKDNILRFARGELEGEVEEVWGIGTNVSKLPEKLRNSWLGEKLDEKGQLAFLKKTFGNSIPVAQEALASMMKEWSAVGVTSEFISQFKEMKREVEKLLAQQGNKVNIEEKKD